MHGQTTPCGYLTQLFGSSEADKLALLSIETEKVVLSNLRLQHMTSSQDLARDHNTEACIHCPRNIALYSILISWQLPGHYCRTGGKGTDFVYKSVIFPQRIPIMRKACRAKNFVHREFHQRVRRAFPPVSSKTILNQGFISKLTSTWFRETHL